MLEVKQYGTKFGMLSGAALKFIACIAMFIDHFGLMIYPTEMMYRVIGRIAFPIFAYFIAEGCRYTRNKLKHLMLVFSVGVIYLFFYLFVFEEVYASVFLTFSISILNIYIIDALKKIAFNERNENGKINKVRAVLALLTASLALAVSYIPFHFFLFDYGYIGMLAPVLISLFDFKGVNAPKILLRLDSYYVRLLVLMLCCIGLAIKNPQLQITVFGCSVSVQVFNQISIPLLLTYNGKAGNKKMKYFFYLFYPLHLGVITLISFFIG